MKRRNTCGKPECRGRSPINAVLRVFMSFFLRKSICQQKPSQSEVSCAIKNLLQNAYYPVHIWSIVEKGSNSRVQAHAVFPHPLHVASSCCTSTHRREGGDFIPAPAYVRAYRAESSAGRECPNTYSLFISRQSFAWLPSEHVTWDTYGIIKQAKNQTTKKLR